MTNGYIDIKNTDMMLIMGGNPAENHPCGFKWAIEAKRNRNAKMIVVDPRFTRTASVADKFAQIRAGTDIAFLGGLIRYAIEKDRIAKDYVVNYTNAGFIVSKDFKLPEDEGVFSGFDEKAQTYDQSSWNYAGAPAAQTKPGGPAVLPPMPEKTDCDPTDGSFDGWMKRITPKPSKPGNWDSFNYYGNTPKFAVNMQKAFYGDAATKQNGWAYDYLPKVDRNYSWVQMWDNMYNGIVKGIFAFGMNGVAIGPDTKKNIDALKKADWLVVGEIYPDETSEFWMSPGITADEQKTIQTTVYRLPCAGFAEKDGTFTNSARGLQWKNAGLPLPPGCRLDQDIVAQIFLKVRELYKKDGA